MIVVKTIYGDYMKIVNIHAREILDSRGWPTVEVELELENGVSSIASVPSGASVGNKEAVELRDNDINRYLGRGVLKAVENVNTIIKDSLIGMDVLEQEKIDKKLIELDGTQNKSKLGSNAILACSLAVLKASSIIKKIPIYKMFGSNYKMPIPMFNVINGGVHASNNLSFQEFMILPNKETFSEGLRVCDEVFHVLNNELKIKNLSTGVGDEGGFSPDIYNTFEVLEVLCNAIKKAGYIPGKDVLLAIDVAANSFYRDKNYYYENKIINAEELLFLYKKIIAKYPVVSIEDPFYESDYTSYKSITKQFGEKIQIVGDDLFATNKKYLKRGIENEIANAILIKMNQVGTITEMLETVRLAKQNNYKIIISHRSGETEDTTIADLSVGLGADMIKAGSLSRGERICKYNRLLRIEEKIKHKN